MAESHIPVTQSETALQMEAPFFAADWEVLPKQFLFCRHGEQKKVEPRVMRVFLCLAEKSGEVVSRERLLELVWGDTAVNEDALSRAISDLRKTLGDSPRKPALIQTIPKSGYRLIAPVKQAGASGNPPPMHREPHPLPKQRLPSPWWWLCAIAVMAGASLWIRDLLDREPALEIPPLLLAKPLTSYPGHESFPALSPDGQLVAFSWGEDSPQERFDIYVKAPGQETPVQLTAHPGYESYPAWSPDGLSIAFVRAGEDGKTGIYRVNLVGGQETKLLDTKSWVVGLDWSPDGQYLVMAERESPETATAIFKVSLGDRQRIRLTTPPETFRGDYQPKVSPDGRQVAFLRRNPLNRGHIMAVPFEGGEPRKLLGNQNFVRGMTWLQDNRHLLVSTYRNGRFGLWRIGLEDHFLEWVMGRGEHIFQPTMAPSGSRLVYETGPFKINVWQLTRHSSGWRENPLIQSNRLDGEAVFSPDGARIAFVSARSGDPKIWVCGADGKAPQAVTEANGLQHERPVWSPDGETLAFATQEDDRTSIYTLKLDGGVPQRVFTETAACLLTDWADAGKALLFSSDRSGSWQIWCLNLADGTLRQVTQNGGLMAHQGADGLGMYFTKPKVNGIWWQPENGEAQLVVEDLSSFAWGAWTVHPLGIYYVRFERNEPKLCRYLPRTGTTTILSPIHEIHNPGLSVSPDGNRILFSRVARGQSDLMLAESPPE